MFASWLIYTIVILALLYALLRAFFYKSLAQKEQKELDALKLTLQESEILIKKQQLQLNRGDGHIEILTLELNALKNDLKTTKAKNTQLRLEIDRYKARIKDLEQKLEALL
ncbi:MAG: hypothetical protein E7K04_01860 [Helicobacter sp.]|nr:hypothetical protein [Helicobacter sp.]